MKINSFAIILGVLGFFFQSASARQPNIILILADDIGIEGLGCYGGESYKTPHLDKMAKEGMRFTHAYSQPLCTPTRVEIMTGRDNHRNWLYFGILDPKERTFGHLMKVAGYRTCISGKWQLQSYDPPDFPNAQWRRATGMQVEDAGFEEYSLYHSWHTEDKGSRYADPTLFQNGTLLKDLKGKYGPDLNLEFVLDFMRRHREEPVFIYYPMALPHWPFNPTPKSQVWSESPDRRLEADVKYFPDMVEYMDHLVGKLIKGVQALGLDEETLILFYSDNGTDQKVTSKFKGKMVKGGKATPQQTGIRVPLIARWPGVISESKVSNQLVEASDFLPTLAKLAGMQLPGNWQVDGQSFLHHLKGERGQVRESCFFWYDPRPGWDKNRFTRHVFALNHEYKLFSDGRFYGIKGEGVEEKLLEPHRLSSKARKAREMLQKVIDRQMQEPVSAAAKKWVDAYGNPIEEK